MTAVKGAALVTGAAGGIGQHIAKALLAAGHRVIAWDADVSPLMHWPAVAQERMLLRQVDITDTASVEAELARVLGHDEGVEVLVNNAGISGPTVPASRYERADWDRVLAVNLTAPFEISRRVGPAMAQRGYGRIVNVSSIGGVKGIADASAYSASKAGLIGLTMSLAKEYIETGVTCNCIAPALIETPLLNQMTSDYAEAARRRIPMGRIGLPEEVAAMVAWIASPACSFTTGAVFDVSGGRLIA